jgi:hypothetical protein
MRSETADFNKSVFKGLAPKAMRSLAEVLEAAGVDATPANLTKARKAINDGIAAGTVVDNGEKTRGRKYARAPKA